MIKAITCWILRIVLLVIIYIPIYLMGAVVVAAYIPDSYSEPGLLSDELGMLILSIISSLLVVGLILSSRMRGWKLAGLLALAYYGSFTFMTQIETWFFLTRITVTPELLPRLFIMGLTIPFVFVPIATWVCGKWRVKDSEVATPLPTMPLTQWAWKFALISWVYVAIYWCAGYFIAWQNPELRSFYGSPGDITPFWEHTISTIRGTPNLLLLQLARGLLFAGLSLPLILGSKVKPWLTAILVGLLLAVPHLGHILPNPLMPLASVRFSHMIETFTSTFVFGLIIVWLFHRRHSGISDLLGIQKRVNV